jgi:type I restriction enzyme S subunit
MLQQTLVIGQDRRKVATDRWKIPSSWQWKSLGEIGFVAGGGTPSTRDTSNFEAGGVPWITPADLSGNDDTYVSHGKRSLSERGLASSGAVLLPPETVLFSSRAPIGYCVLAATSLATSQGFKNLVLNPALSPHYVRDYLKGSVGYAESQASGTTFKELSASKFAGLRIPVPPPNEQVRIATRLSFLNQRTITARSGVSAAQRAGRHLRAAILRSAFSGVLTANWRKSQSLEDSATLVKRTPAPNQPAGGRKATERIVANGVALRINVRETPLPVGWSWQSLLQIARQETGHTPSRSVSTYWDGEIPWVGVRDAAAHHGKVIMTTQQTISQSGLENSSARILPVGTILLCRTAGSIGHVCQLGRPMATSQDFAAWVCGPALDPTYLMYLLMGERDLLRRLGRGTAHPTVYLPEIRAMSIALAPLPEQVEIVRQLNALLVILAQADTDIEAAAALTANFDKRLHKLAFSGELEPVTEMEGLVDAALARNDAELKMKTPQRRTLQSRKKSEGVPSVPAQLAAKYDVWPASGFLFEELRDTIDGTYDEVRAALFDALRTAQLTQRFDARRRVMVLDRKIP